MEEMEMNKLYRVVEAFEIDGEPQDEGAEIELNDEDAARYAAHIELVEEGDDDEDDDDDMDDEDEDDDDSDDDAGL